MKRLSHWRITWSLAFLLVLVLATPGVGAQQVELTLRLSDQEFIWDIYEAAVDRYEELNPGVTVKVEHSAAGEGPRWEQFAVEVAAGVGPDIMFAESRRAVAAAHNGILLDLTEYVAKDLPDRGDFFPPAFADFTYNDRIHGIPHSFGVPNIAYNVGMVNAAGVTINDETWTWDDFLDIGRKLTKDTNGDGTPDVRAINLNQWMSWFWGAGGELMSEDGTRSTLYTPEGVLGLRTYTSYTTEHGISGPGSWENGAVAMRDNTGPAAVPDLLQRAPFEWAVAMHPIGPARRASRIFADGWVISAITKHPDEAWKLVKFLTSEEGLEFQARGLRAIPARSSVALNVYLAQDAPIDLTPFVKSVEFGHPYILSPAFTQINSTYNQMVNRVINGEMSVEQALIQTDEAINAILSSIK